MFSLPYYAKRISDPHVLLSKLHRGGGGGFSPEEKGTKREAKSLPASNGHVNDASNYISSLPLTCITWYFIKYRDNFTCDYHSAVFSCSLITTVNSKSVCCVVLAENKLTVLKVLTVVV